MSTIMSSPKYGASLTLMIYLVYIPLPSGVIKQLVLNKIPHLPLWLSLSLTLCLTLSPIHLVHPSSFYKPPFLVGGLKPSEKIWKIWVRQLGWLFQIYGKLTVMFQSPPTRFRSERPAFLGKLHRGNPPGPGLLVNMKSHRWRQVHPLKSAPATRDPQEEFELSFFSND